MGIIPTPIAKLDVVIYGDIHEFVMFQYFATYSQGVCAKISRLVFVPRPLFYNGKSCVEARILLLSVNNSDSLSSFTFPI